MINSDYHAAIQLNLYIFELNIEFKNNTDTFQITVLHAFTLSIKH